MNPFCLSNINKHLTSEELLKGSFGIEWESLRAYSDGKLSLRPHPSVLETNLAILLLQQIFQKVK